LITISDNSTGKNTPLQLLLACSRILQDMLPQLLSPFVRTACCFKYFTILDLADATISLEQGLHNFENIAGHDFVTFNIGMNAIGIIEFVIARHTL